MTFIEQLFGLFPDNGSGATELGILLAVIAVVIVRRLFSPFVKSKYFQPSR